MVLVCALTFARCLIEHSGPGAGGRVGTLALACLVIKLLQWAAVAFCLAHAPTGGVAEGFTRRALLVALTDAATEVRVEGVAGLTGLATRAGTGAGLLVDGEWSGTRLPVEHTLALAEPGIECVTERTPLVAALALAASSAEVLASGATSHTAVSPICFSQLKKVYSN